jgi:hypothetical protein
LKRLGRDPAEMFSFNDAGLAAGLAARAAAFYAAVAFFRGLS